MAAPEGGHHNAGDDARESIESVLAMLIAWSGTRKPADDWQMPILVAVDLYAHQAALCKKTKLTRLTVSARLVVWPVVITMPALMLGSLSRACSFWNNFRNQT